MSAARKYDVTPLVDALGAAEALKRLTTHNARLRLALMEAMGYWAAEYNARHWPMELGMAADEPSHAYRRCGAVLDLDEG